MSVQPPSVTHVKPLTSKSIANLATPARKEMIEIAAHALHRAARFHARIRLGRVVGRRRCYQIVRGRAADCEPQNKAGVHDQEIVRSLRHKPRKNDCRAARAVFETGPLPWYIPQFAILRVLR